MHPDKPFQQLRRSKRWQKHTGVYTNYKIMKNEYQDQSQSKTHPLKTANMQRGKKSIDLYTDQLKRETINI